MSGAATITDGVRPRDPPGVPGARTAHILPALGGGDLPVLRSLIRHPRPHPEPIPRPPARSRRTEWAMAPPAGLPLHPGPVRYEEGDRSDFQEEPDDAAGAVW